MATRLPISLPCAPAAFCGGPSKTAPLSPPTPANRDDPEPLRLRVVAGPGYWSARAVMVREAWIGQRRRTDVVDEEAILAELCRRSAARGSRKRVAFEIGVTYSALGQILARKIPIPHQAAERLGFRLVEDVRRRLFERVG